MPLNVFTCTMTGKETKKEREKERDRKEEGKMKDEWVLKRPITRKTFKRQTTNFVAMSKSLVQQ